LLDVGLLDYVREHNLPLAEHGHLQAESHEAWAKNILIPEIEKRL
jgi:hypothetical protein